MNKIIVGFDATDQALDALRLAARLGERLGSQLIVASAIEFGPLEIEALNYNEATAEHHRRVFERASKVLGRTGFEKRELQDSAARGLTRLAEVERADLIVIGSTHRGPIGRVVAGSVASALLHGSPCGVLVAPRGWGSAEHPPIETIGVGFDGSDESAAALARAVELGRACDAGLRVIAIAPYLGPTADPTAVGGNADSWARRIEAAVEAIPAGLPYETVIRQGREATELALQGVDLDLLVVGSRGYGPLRRTIAGSVADELVRTVPCPILVVPRGARERTGTSEATPNP